jgi:hypothetical protein
VSKIAEIEQIVDIWLRRVTPPLSSYLFFLSREVELPTFTADAVECNERDVNQ